MRKLLLSVLLLCATIASFGQSLPISRWEYYFDTDPGAGNANPIPVTLSDSFNSSVSISVVGLTTGYHRCYIRFADSAGAWGQVESMLLNVADTVRLRKGEYYIDTDPGPGLGNLFSFPANDSINHAISISSTGLNGGYHRAYFRYRDNAGNWGPAEGTYFYVKDTAPASLYVTSPLVAGEYFIDTIRAAGSGTMFSVATADTAETLLSIPVAGLSTGYHRAYIRYRDQSGRWGSIEDVLFYVNVVVADAHIATPVTYGEYFLDTDPGKGSATAFSVAAGDTSINTIPINTTGLATGLHTVFVRYADSGSVWGNVQQVQFIITDTSAPYIVPVAPSIVKGEYFIDIDPGPGSALPISVSAADSVQDTLYYNTTGLAPGLHTVFTRFADASGAWGDVQFKQFIITDTVAYTSGLPAARVLKGEYFFDVDPGTGNGVAIAITTADTSISTLSVSVTGLALGSHSLFFRFADTTSKWGNVQSVAINIADTSSAFVVPVAPRVTRGEYFVDTDPGPGNGIAISVSSSDTVLFTSGFSVAGLPAGWHTVFFRFADSMGKWGQVQPAQFGIIDTTGIRPVFSPRLKKGEYFVDTDPGPGNGTAISSSLVDTASATFNINTSGMPAGLHSVFVRYADSAGKWGTVQFTQFTIQDTSHLFVNPASLPVVYGEYYFDTDRGPGTGTPIPGIAAGDTIIEAFNLPTTALGLGYHTGYLRFKDSAGKWGQPCPLQFLICNVPVTMGPVTGPNNVCTGSNITLSDSASGGTWSSGNSAVATINTSGVVYGLSLGTTIITYTKTNSCGTGIVTKLITVNSTAPVVGNIAGTHNLCSGVPVNFADSVGGGTWASSNTLVATISTTGQVTGINSGTAIITYQLNNGCGIATDTQLVTVFPVVLSVGPITGPDSLCSGISVAFSDTTMGGVWASSAPALASVNATGLVTGIAAGSVTISYTLSNICASATATKAVLVLPGVAMAGTISGAATVCTGASITLSDTVTGGVWSVTNSNATVSGGLVGGVAAGNDTVYYTVTTTCGTAYASKIISVITLPVVGGISGTLTTCSGRSDSLRNTIAGGVWTSSDTTIVSVNTVGVYTGRRPGTAIIHYSLTNSCGSADTSAMLTINAITWMGGAAGYEHDWNVAANWSCGAVPAIADYVVVPVTTYAPVISMDYDVHIHQLSLNNTVVLIIDTFGQMSVYGNVQNNGSIGGGGIFTLSGSARQHISGTGSIEQLRLNNSGGVVIDSGDRLTVAAVLNVLSDTLFTNDSLVLHSDSALTARVAPITATGAFISGTVRVMQYVPGGMRRFRFWSHPFSNYIGLNQALTSIDITGAGGVANGFTTTASNAPSAFLYNPLVGNSSMGYDPGWRPFSSTAATADSNRVHQFQGIRLFFRGARGQGLGYGAYTPSPVTISQWGLLNQGDLSVPLVKGSSANQDYNMVGNPYASPVDIGTVLFNARAAGSIAGGSFYIWNPTLGAAGQYQALAISTVAPTPYYLQANCAFQVRAAYNGAALSFHETDKGQVASASLLRSLPGSVGLVVYDKQYHPWDMLSIRFDQLTTADDDNWNDARKLSVPDFSFYSVAQDSSKLCIDHRPFSANHIVPLGMVSTYAQDFIIRAEQVVVPQGCRVVLHDKLLEQFLPLQAGTEYRFSVTGNRATQGNRFELRMDSSTTSAVSSGLEFYLSPNPATDELILSFTGSRPEDIAINICDLNGVTVYQRSAASMQSGRFVIPLVDLASGVYIVGFTHGSATYKKKLVKE